MYDTATPYLACYVLVRRNGKIAFVLRENTDWMKNHYSLPSGKVEKDETLTEAAIREAKEEIGVDINEEDLKFVHIVHRHDDIDWIDVCFEATKWRGEPYNAEPHVHSKMEWLDPNNLPENIVPSANDLLMKISKGKSYSEYGW